MHESARSVDLECLLVFQKIHQTSLSHVAIPPAEETEGTRADHPQVPRPDYRLLSHHQVALQVLDPTSLKVSST